MIKKILTRLVFAVAMLTGYGGIKSYAQKVQMTNQISANQANAEANALNRKGFDIPQQERAYLILPNGIRVEGASGFIAILPQGNHNFNFRGQDFVVGGGGGSAVPIGGGFSVGVSAPSTRIENSITGEGTVEAGKYYTVVSDATLIGGILKSVSIVELTNEELEQAKGLVAEWLSLMDGAVIGGLRWAGTNVGEVGCFIGTPNDFGNYYTFDEAQVACPEGWRTPTTKEFAALIAVGHERTHVGGVSGRMFGSGDNRVFFPGGGCVNIGGVYKPNNEGFYWSSTPKKKTAYGLSFNSVSNLIFNMAGMGMSRKNAMSVRCVKEELMQ